MPRSSYLYHCFDGTRGDTTKVTGSLGLFEQTGAEQAKTLAPFSLCVIRQLSDQDNGHIPDVTSQKYYHGWYLYR